jgi:predicted GH43/DUF377 family glycosyl hydrolase
MSAIVDRAGEPAERPYQLHRLSVVMRPHLSDPLEEGGVLNPGGARARSGEYLLFPRLVAPGNYSRIGIARVLYDLRGVPIDVERVGMALEPEEPYELNEWTGGGCEDPRVVFVPALDTYVMTYVAFGPTGPRTAIAVSHDLYSWTRLGLIEYGPLPGADMNAYTNKDHMVFPEPVQGPDGRPSIALLHRPVYETWGGDMATHGHPLPPPPGLPTNRWSMWLSYCPLDDADWAAPVPGKRPKPARFSNHHWLAGPECDWDADRVGGGTPPVRLDEGWLMIYHGVENLAPPENFHPAHLPRRYCAGAMVLDVEDPRRILYRSPEPTLVPLLPEERSGVVNNVVFPTAVDQRPGYLDIYYGMADACIGVARMQIEPDPADPAALIHENPI